MRDTTPNVHPAASKFTVEKLPFDKIPNQSKLFLEFLESQSALETFYPAAVQKIDDLPARVSDVLANYTTSRDKLADALLEANQLWQAAPQTLENIERLRQSDCVAVVTGQQAGLFTGALYTVYKAFSIVKAAEKLRARGVNAVPIFWIASEDHDFAEVAETFVLDRENRLVKIEIETDAANENLPVGKILTDDSMKIAVEQLFDRLPKTELTAQLRDLIAETYQPNRSLSECFARLMTKLFGKSGLILLDPLDANLKNLAAPIYELAVKRSAEITNGLIEQNRKLAEQGFHQQIKVENDSFPFFLFDADGKRAALERANEKIKVKKQKTEFALEDLIRIASENPQRLSPNATLRAAVQDFLLPTVCYFGGAAEVAYFAQTAPVYKILERPPTAVFHRASLSVVEPNVRRTFEKYDLSFADFFAKPEALQAKIVGEYLNSDAAEVFRAAEENIRIQLDRLNQSLATIDRTLADNLANRRKKILWHINALQNKFVKAEMRRSETANRRLETAFAQIYPRAALQERSLNVVWLFALHGENVLEWIYQAIDVDAKEHQILYL